MCGTTTPLMHEINMSYFHLLWWNSLHNINASVTPSAQLMDLVRNALMTCYDLNTERHQGSEGNEHAGNLSLRRPCVCPNHRCKRHHSGQVKERQIGREMCPVWLHLSSVCVFLCVGVWLWLRMFTWVMLDMWDEVCMCLQLKYRLNC